LYNWDVKDDEDNNDEDNNDEDNNDEDNNDEDNNEKKIDDNNSNMKKKVEIKPYNKYKCIGKIYEFSFFIKNKNVDNDSTFNYEDFKKMNISS
jgi:hypothetical protein